MRTPHLLAALLATIPAFFSPAGAQPCTPEWASGVVASSVGSTINAVAVYDHGTGPYLYIAGAFPMAGADIYATRVARWDGTQWVALPPAGLGGTAHAMTVFDDGSGPGLYIGGEFTSVPGVGAANRIVRWNGSSWSTLTSGLNGMVRALTVFDEGSGPALFVGGAFTTAGGQPAGNIARWNGAAWSALGTGTNAMVRALAVYDNGSGPALFAGGAFSIAGGQSVGQIARWDGAAWSSIGGATGGNFVNALAVCDHGQGPVLYVGGGFAFVNSGAIFSPNIARWDGAWSAVGGLSSGGVGPLAVHALHALPQGPTQTLIAAGEFTSAGGNLTANIASFDEDAWSSLAGGLTGPIVAVGSFDFGASPALLAGTPVAVGRNEIARWNGSQWRALGAAPDGPVLALATHDDGGGAALYLGGEFTVAGTAFARGIARFDGKSWQNLGSGLAGGGTPRIRALQSFDDGSGPALYAGGEFSSIGGVSTIGIARWNGQWSQLGTVANQLNGTVFAIAVFDDGAGPALYAAGTFGGTGSNPLSRIARWAGSGWAPLGAGLAGGIVYTLEVFDDGSGPALYAGGAFNTAGGEPANRIARWNGSNWSTLGDGLSNTVRSLAVYNDGSGTALYAGGNFLMAGGAPAQQVARWDGAAWSPLGDGIGWAPNTYIQNMKVFDDGSGPALYITGLFSTAGGQPSQRIARWNGSTWSTPGTGLSVGTSGQALAVFTDHIGPALYIGGVFQNVSGIPGMNLARWGCTTPPPQPCYPNCDASTTPPILNIADFSCFLQKFAAGDPYANCDQSTIPPVLNVADFSCFLSKFAAGCP